MHILETMAEIEDLPKIITAPSDYITRNGDRVTISEVQPDSSPYTFKAKGSIWKMFRGAMRPRGNDVWHKSGRLDMVAEKGGDIVGIWKD